jgi:hypothetical protein
MLLMQVLVRVTTLQGSAAGGASAAGQVWF